MAENFDKMSVARVAKALHKDRSTVHRWKAAGMPTNRDGTLSLAAVVEWMLGREKESALEDQAMNGADSPALERYREARAVVIVGGPRGGGPSPGDAGPSGGSDDGARASD